MCQKKSNPPDNMTDMTVDEQRYQTIFNNIYTAVSIFEPVASGEDFIFIDHNQYAEQMTRIPREHLLGKKVTEMFPGIKNLELLEAMRRVSGTGRPEQLPPFYYQDDRISGWRKCQVYRLANGEIVVVYTDETEHFQAIEAMRESESRFRSLVEYSADHIFMIDRQGRYLFSNDRVDQFNVERGETLIGRSLEEIYSPDLAARYRRLVNRVFDTGEVVVFEHEIETPDGDGQHMDTLYPVFKDGRLWVVGGICHDISQRKKYERELQKKSSNLKTALEELRRTQRRFVDQERQRALSQMACGIAHDFNNALSSILGFSDLLLQVPGKIHDPETVTNYLTLINVAAQNAAQTVRKLRQFYRFSDNETVRPIDLYRLIDEAVNLTEPRWKHHARAMGIQIEIDIKIPEGLLVKGNPAELRELLTNLIFNAVDAMPDGGLIRFFGRPDDSWIILEVDDTGIGMEPAVREQCLNPFFTTKGEAGSGLGLASVQGIVTRHQGRIDIRSRPGQGTTFIIHLPAAVEETSFSRTNGSNPAHLHDLKILVVDDEENQRRILVEFLKKDHHRVETAVNGLDGLKKFNNGWYDLIITDLAMPDFNGSMLAGSIKKNAPEKPVILLTGFGDMIEAFSPDTDAFDLVLTKPVSLNALREGIRRVMKKSGAAAAGS